MINLLSPTAEKALRREYRLRLLVIWSLLFSGLFITLTIFLLPTYVLVHAQISSLRGESEKHAEITARFKEAEQKITDTNKLIDALSVSQGKPAQSFSALLEAVQAARSPRIEYQTILIERKKGVVEKIQVQGKAHTRADLIALRSTLERSPLFDGVSVPLSDLARDSELPFAITVSVVNTQ